jgi:hypothetical protein
MEDPEAVCAGERPEQRGLKLIDVVRGASHGPLPPGVCSRALASDRHQ